MISNAARFDPLIDGAPYGGVPRYASPRFGGRYDPIPLAFRETWPYTPIATRLHEITDLWVTSLTNAAHVKCDGLGQIYMQGGGAVVCKRVASFDLSKAHSIHAVVRIQADTGGNGYIEVSPEALVGGDDTSLGNKLLARLNATITPHKLEIVRSGVQVSATVVDYTVGDWATLKLSVEADRTYAAYLNGDLIVSGTAVGADQAGNSYMGVTLGSNHSVVGKKQEIGTVTLRGTLI